MKPHGQNIATVLLATAAAGWLYGLTLSPTVAAGDAGELALAADRGAIPHPPGYPLWVMLAWLFVRLPLIAEAGDVAWRANLLSAAFGAAAAGVVVLLGRRLGLSRPAAVLSAGLLAVVPAVWHASTRAEVYSLNLLLLALTGLAWLMTSDRPTRGRRFSLGLVWGALLMHHQANLVLLPLAIASMHNVLRPFTLRGILSRAVRAGAPIAAGLAVSLLPAAWMILRRATRPDLDWFGHGDAFGLDAFSRSLYGPLQQNPFAPDLAFAQVEATLTVLVSSFGPALLFVVLGLLSWRRRRPRVLSVAAGASALCLAGPWLILNPVPDAAHVVSLATTWFPAFLAGALAAGAGLDALNRFVARRLDDPGAAWRTPVAAGVVSAAVLLVTVLFSTSTIAGFPGSRGDRVARSYGEDLMSGLPSGATLFVEGDNELFLTAYLQKAEGVRGDVTVLHRKGYLFDDPFGLRGLAGRELKARQAAAEARFVAEAAGPVYFVSPPEWATDSDILARREGLVWRLTAPERLESAGSPPWPWPDYHAAVWNADPRRLDFVTRKCLVAYYEAWAHAMCRAGRDEDALLAWQSAVQVGHDFAGVEALAEALKAPGYPAAVRDDLYGGRIVPIAVLVR